MRRQAMSTATEVESKPLHLQLLEDAVEEVENDEVFIRWLRFRGSFHNYSLWNSLLIALQCPHATFVAGYRQWQRAHNRQVQKGEKGIVILAPIVRSFDIEDDTGETRKARRTVGFRGAYVFDVSQTDGDPLPEPPPMATVRGDSHREHIAPLVEHADSLGYTVAFEPLSDCEGYCDRHAKKIAVQESAPANAQLRIIVHELIHAHGVHYDEFGRQLAETITDSATYVVCRSLGLDITMTVAQYVAGWSDREIREKALSHIDHYAAQVERALGLHDRQTSLPDDIKEVSQ